MTTTFRIGVNRLWPGQKLPAGDHRWGKYTRSFHAETHSLDSFMKLVRSGFAFSPVMKDSHRAKPNFIEGQHLVLDFDNGETSSSLDSLLLDDFIRQHAAFLYPTLSSTQENPKSRVVFVLSEPVTNMETFDSLARAMVSRFPDSDQTVGEASRFLYGSNPKTGKIIPLGNILSLDLAKSLLPRIELKPISAFSPKHRANYYPPLTAQYTVLEIINSYAPRIYRENSNPKSRWSLRCPLCVVYVESESNSFTVADDNNLWHCFACNQSGNAYELLKLLGDEPEKPQRLSHLSDQDNPFTQLPDLTNELHLQEIERLLGQDTPQHFYRHPLKKKRNVQKNVIQERPYNVNLHTRDGGSRPGLWKRAEELLPYPSSVRPSGKHSWLYGDGHLIRVTFKSKTWHNPVNAQYMRRLIYFNLFPKLNSCEPYVLRVSIDDWSPTYWHNLKQKIKRKGGECTAMNNLLRRGYMLCITNLALPGWEKIDHDVIDSVLVESLKAIDPGQRDPKSKFHGYLASHGWSGLSTGEKITNELELIAVEETPIDDIQTEAELTASGIPYEYHKAIWARSQGDRTLDVKCSTPEAAVRFLSDLGCTLTKKGRAYLARMEVGVP